MKSIIIVVVYFIGLIISKSNSWDPKIAFCSFRFGFRFNESAPITNRDYFLTHLRSIGSFKNTTFLYFTDHVETKIPFPSNAIQVQIEWVDLITKLEVFVGALFPSLINANYYKLCDFKPLIPLLYPEHFRKYEWIGWIDNDAWYSSELEKFIIYYSKNGYSQLNLLRKDGNRFSWGPISIFTWDFYKTYVNVELKKEQNRQILVKVLNDTDYCFFDEWGNSGKGTFHNSFSRILFDIYKINPHLKNLHIAERDEVNRTEILGMAYDGMCKNSKNTSSHCGYCLLMIKGGETYLYAHKVEGETLLQPKEDGSLWKGHLMCHFEYAKRIESSSLTIFNNSVTMKLLSQKEIVVDSTYHQGIQIIK